MMLNIVKGEENELIVTATEKTTINNANYLFVFLHDVTKTQKAFILSDTSLFPKYNIFTFTEGSDEDHTLNTGQHTYSVYAQASNSNVDPDLADELVEQGIANVTSEQEPVNAFINDDAVKQFEA